MKQTTPGRLVMIGLVWLTARLLFAASIIPLDVPPFGNIVFDEAEYLFESLALSRGEPVVFYKGPILYLVTGGVFLVSPTLAAARCVSLLFDLALMAAFWLSVRRDDEELAFAGTLFLAACPLSVWFSFHLLTDVPLALFSFLAVLAYARRETPGALAATSAFFTLAVLVKSTAILILPVLVVCALVWRRRLAGLAAAAFLPLIVYVTLPFVWPQTPDTHFLSSVASMSFRCGFFYFALATLLAAGPALTAAAAWLPVARRRGGQPSPLPRLVVASAIALAILYAAYTLFGDAQPKYVMTFIPFLALLAGSVVRRGRLLAAAVVVSLIWITPVARWMEDDYGMTGVAAWLRNTGSDTVYTTIPDGVHRHAFQGSLHFVSDLTLAEHPAPATGSGGYVIWTDWLGKPEELEASLDGRGLEWRRIDFYTNRNVRPVYLVEGAIMPEPLRIRWEENILTRPFLTPIDLPVQPMKRAIYRFFRPASPSDR